jgi:N,N-dimethylformamidase
MRPGHTRGESYASDLYLLAWLEQENIAYDVITDEDLHFGGGSWLRNYRLVISGTHPEYASVDMYDAIRRWVHGGGRYAYLGGNGFTSNVTWRADRPWLMENRATGRHHQNESLNRYEAVHALDGKYGGPLADIGRSAGSLFGVDWVTMGFDRSYPVFRSATSNDAALAFAFEGVDRAHFGSQGLSRGGGVIGEEWDNARHVAGAPGHFVLASSVDHSLIPAILGAENPHHGDVVLYFQGDGVVFSVGSMAWCKALHANNYMNDTARFTGNVIRRMLDPAPMKHP